MIGPLAMILLGGIYLLFRNNEHTIPSILSNTKSNEIEEFDRAESFYLKRLQVSPHGGLNQAALASIYVSKSKLTGNLQYMDKAEVLARKSLENLPYYNYEAQLVMAKVSETRHFFPEAIMRAKAVLNQKPIHQGALLTLVSSLLGYGKLNEAERYSSQLIELSPTIEPYAMRALVYLAQGKEQNALRDFQSALNSETVEDVRQSAWVRSLIGRYYLEKGFLSTSYKYLVSSLALVDDFHMALALMAELDEKKGNYKRADDNYSRAFKSKGEPAYLIKQARLREKTGDAQRSLWPLLFLSDNHVIFNS